MLQIFGEDTQKFKVKCMQEYIYQNQRFTMYRIPLYEEPNYKEWAKDELKRRFEEDARAPPPRELSPPPQPLPPIITLDSEPERLPSMPPPPVSMPPYEPGMLAPHPPPPHLPPIMHYSEYDVLPPHLPPPHVMLQELHPLYPPHMGYPYHPYYVDDMSSEIQ